MTHNKAATKECPVSAVAEILSDTWTMLIVHNLLKAKTLRFCELERGLEGISTRTLTLKLKALEDDGLVLKSDEGYSMTSLGLKLKPVIKAMEQFGNQLSR